MAVAVLLPGAFFALPEQGCFSNKFLIADGGNPGMEKSCPVTP